MVAACNRLLLGSLFVTTSVLVPLLASAFTLRPKLNRLHRQQMPPFQKISSFYHLQLPALNVKGHDADEAITTATTANIQFRQVTLEDLPICSEIELSSYPSNEAASIESLKTRQKFAAPYFQCAVLPRINNDDNEDEDSIEEVIVGFICSTRCDRFDEESMSKHVASGKMLAIHSVVVKEEYRRKGFATKMLNNYIAKVKEDENDHVTFAIDKIVLIAKSRLLGFYVNCGFSVIKSSDIVHGQDMWYDLQMVLEKNRYSNNSSSNSSNNNNNERNEVIEQPNKGESWFVKTEQFTKPFPVVKPHLEAHRQWVTELKSQGYCVTSGYRVDSEGKPGGGGMLFFAAKSYDDAKELVLNDPLIINDCVDWCLNGWIPEIGDISLR